MAKDAFYPLRLLGIALLILAVLSPLAGCSRRTTAGRVKIDGSSTVFPITEAVAEQFQNEDPTTRVTVGISGTGGGFKKFVSGEIDIVDASRPIKKEEKKEAEANDIDYVEIEVAFDGLSVVTNPKNTFVDSLTTDELKKIWEPESKVALWKHVRSDWPENKMVLFGPGTDSGTFDYFTEAIVGEEGASRSDYTASEDDNVLVEGVTSEENSLGYFGYAYYVENKAKLKVIPVDGGEGPIAPTEKSIRSGSYPLSRPLYLYVSSESLKKPEVRQFTLFYLQEVNSMLKEVGYVSLPKKSLQEQLEKLEKKIDDEKGTP